MLGTVKTLTREISRNGAIDRRPELLDRVDFLRLDVARQVDRDRQSELGQFLTPASTARLMASMFEATSTVHLLDAGSGIGSLSAAFVEQSVQWSKPPKQISVTAYEIDPNLLTYLN